MGPFGVNGDALNPGQDGTLSGGDGRRYTGGLGGERRDGCGEWSRRGKEGVLGRDWRLWMAGKGTVQTVRELRDARQHRGGGGMVV